MTVRKGDLVAITFDDHAQGHETIRFVVVGKVVKQTRKEISVACWYYADESYEPPADDSNVHKYTIVKSAIVGAVKLTRLA